jgi:predicted secreted protein
MNPLRRVAAALSAVALLAGLTAISAAPASAAKKPTLTVFELPAQVRLVPGESIQITLSTNRTTGYSWSADGGCCTKDDKLIAKVSKGVYKAPDNTNGMVGVPGTTTWTVTAKRVGTTDIEIITTPPGAENTMSDEVVGTLKLIVMKPQK